MHACIHLCKYPSVYEHGADGDRQFLSFEYVSLLNAVGLLPFLFIFFYFFISISGGVTSFYFSFFFSLSAEYVSLLNSVGLLPSVAGKLSAGNKIAGLLLLRIRIG